MKSKYLVPSIFFSLLVCASAAYAGRYLPVQGKITSGVGWRRDPLGSGRMMYHRGVDIAVPVGTAVYPTQVGYVVHAGDYGGYGTAVAIAHGEGFMTVYGHNSEVLVKPGDWVETTTVIARSGNTGRSSGPHVHYEVRQYRGSMKEQQERLVQEIREGKALLGGDAPNLRPQLTGSQG